MSALNYISMALDVVVSPVGVVSLFLSVLLGLIFGMLPGLTATMAVALLTGLTYSFDGPLAVLILIGVYIGAISGGCQSAVLLNIPGTPASAATAVEGYPLARQGKAGLAIFVSNASSFSGTMLGIVCVVLFTPLLTRAALKFNSQEMFLLTVFGIVICGNLTSGGRPVKGWISGFIGLLFSQVGLDTVNSMARYSFGIINLTAGISLLPVMIGLFGFPEIVDAFNPESRTIIPVSKFRIKEGFAVLRRNIVNVVRSAILGVTMGAIPGVGEDTGGWLSYWAEKRSSKKTGWGKGEIDGVVSSETGNNAAVGGAIIPVLSLAIPGSAPAAVLLAAFWMHGYRPGPLLMQDTPEFLYYVVVFMVFSAFMMWLLASNISRFTVKILQIKNEILMPIIFVCCVIGAFVVSNRMFDVKLMFAFGILGIVMRQLKYPAAPFLLGIILGNMADENLRRALILNKGSIASFFTRPISLFFIVFILALLVPQFPIAAKLVKGIKQRRRKKS
ncbi:MAG: tripartite tricarboxylate transporter permease [Spirochaetales bacterium]|jgi:putative tricarboxylic transport membrane protein|nr:tripartite tricarboxylate transporter permease [Spirochaetales bacterium]